MEDVLNVAAYISQRYFLEYNEQMDEMTLHKLMYLIQREAIIQTGEPLFNATFYGWKYGPVLKEILDTTLISVEPKDFIGNCFPILNKVFESYAGKESWSLSRLTQGELSWKNSRLLENADNLMSLEDIHKDAERIKARREMLNRLGLL